MNGGDWLETPIARHVWETKCRRRGDSGPPDRDIEATWQRVADAAAGAEPSVERPVGLWEPVDVLQDRLREDEVDALGL